MNINKHLFVLLVLHIKEMYYFYRNKLNMKNMKNEIKKIQDYFIAKIEAGDFELQKATSPNGGVITIDNEYQFILFFLDGSTKLFQHSFDQFIQLPDIENGGIFVDMVKAQIKQVKLDALEKLQKEINELC